VGGGGRRQQRRRGAAVAAAVGLQPGPKSRCLCTAAKACAGGLSPFLSRWRRRLRVPLERVGALADARTRPPPLLVPPRSGCYPPSRVRAVSALPTPPARSAFGWLPPLQFSFLFLFCPASHFFLSRVRLGWLRRHRRAGAPPLFRGATPVCCRHRYYRVHALPSPAPFVVPVHGGLVAMARRRCLCTVLLAAGACVVAVLAAGSASANDNGGVSGGDGGGDIDSVQRRSALTRDTAVDVSGHRIHGSWGAQAPGPRGRIVNGRVVGATEGDAGVQLYVRAEGP